MRLSIQDFITASILLATLEQEGEYTYPMTRHAAVFIHLPSPSGFFGMGETSKLSDGSWIGGCDACGDTDDDDAPLARPVH